MVHHTFHWDSSGTPYILLGFQWYVINYIRGFGVWIFPLVVVVVVVVLAVVVARKVS